MKLRIREKIALLWALFRDPAVPLYPKAVIPVLVVYLLFPFDIVPDFIPLLGQLDDLVVIGAGLMLFIMLTPADLIEEHLEAFE
jgi:uncharacterized membrane protein YkvA (DUF1232 family)